MDLMEAFGTGVATKLLPCGDFAGEAGLEGLVYPYASCGDKQTCTLSSYTCDDHSCNTFTCTSKHTCTGADSCGSYTLCNYGCP